MSWLVTLLAAVAADPRVRQAAVALVTASAAALGAALLGASPLAAAVVAGAARFAW